MSRDYAHMGTFKWDVKFEHPDTLSIFTEGVP